MERNSGRYAGPSNSISDKNCSVNTGRPECVQHLSPYRGLKSNGTKTYAKGSLGWNY